MMLNKNKTKILLVAPSPDLAGGISRWTKHILNYSKDYGEYCELSFLSQSQHKHSLNKGCLERVRSGVTNYLILLKLFRLELLNNLYDIVHITTSASISLLKDIFLLKISKYYGVRSVIHFHFGRIPELSIKKNWEWKLLKRVIKLSDTAITIDLESYSVLLKEGFDNIVNLPNPLSPNIEHSVEINKHIRREPRSIVFVGQMLKTKGIYELVEACSQIPNIKLNMYGTLPVGVKESLISIAGNKSDKWLNIVGEVNYEQIIGKMLQGAIFVLPTYTEGFPNVILESMACGCPIIASSVGAIPEMLAVNLSEPCGICIRPKDKAELKNKIEYLLNNPEEARTLGVRARNRVCAEYSMSSVWEKLNKIWELNK